jgi:dipeptidase
MEEIVVCDTFVALGNSTKNKKVIFAKNSDREPDEPAEIVYNPRTEHPTDSDLKTTYITIPQVEETAEVILCKPIWIWGAEMGANEYGVAIGNEEITTKEKTQKEGGLLGMDLLRLGLERGKTAKEALEVIVALLETYGQGGNCGYRKKVTYHNSFLIADKKEAWVLETADKYWVAEKVESTRSISNTLSISGTGDSRHPNLVNRAIEKKWCKDEEKFDFKEHYRAKYHLREIFALGSQRYKRSSYLLKKAKGRIDAKIMMKILRDHMPTKENWNPAKDASFKSICNHARDFITRSQSTISMVSVLDDKIQTHWITGTSAPCTSIFKPIFLPGGLPTINTKTTEFYDKNNLWWTHEKLHRLVLQDYTNRLAAFNEEKEKLEDRFLKETHDLLYEITHSARARDVVLDLSKFTRDKYLEAREAELRWIEDIKGMPIKRKANYFYRKKWEKLNRLNKLSLLE